MTVEAVILDRRIKPQLCSVSNTNYKYFDKGLFKFFKKFPEGNLEVIRIGVIRRSQLKSRLVEEL